MRNLLVAAILLFTCSQSWAQIAKKNRSFPSIDVKAMDGSNFNTGDIENDGKPMIISFWATWCKPCIKELSAIADEYEDWQEESGVKLVAISVDDARNMAKVAPFVNGKGWDYDVYIDLNGDLKRAMNVNSVPHTFLLNGNKEVVYSHNSYSPGDEDILYGHVLELLTK